MIASPETPEETSHPDWGALALGGLFVLALVLYLLYWGFSMGCFQTVATAGDIVGCNLGCNVYYLDNNENSGDIIGCSGTPTNEWAKTCPIIGNQRLVRLKTCPLCNSIQEKTSSQWLPCDSKLNCQGIAILWADENGNFFAK